MIIPPKTVYSTSSSSSSRQRSDEAHQSTATASSASSKKMPTTKQQSTTAKAKLGANYSGTEGKVHRQPRTRAKDKGHSKGEETLPVENRKGWLESLGDLRQEPVEHLARDTNAAEHIKEEEAAAPPKPKFVDVFGGADSPLARAMAWCGWDTDTAKKLQSKDLSNTKIFDAVAKAVSRSHAYWVALRCPTLSQACELRTEQCLWGIPDDQTNPPCSAAELAALQADRGHLPVVQSG